MSINVSKTRQLDKNYTQVEVSSKKYPTRYFKVPQAKADEFCDAYKKNDTRTGYISAGIITGTVLLACGITGVLTKNLSKLYKNVIGVGVGLITAIGAMRAVTPLAIKREDKVLKQFNAEEINYKSKKFPI